MLTFHSKRGDSCKESMRKCSSNNALWERLGKQADTIFTCPLIGNHAFWLVIRPSDWESYPLIGHNAFWLTFRGLGDLGLTINLQFKLQLKFSEINFYSDFNFFFLCVLCSLLRDLICVPCLIVHFVPLLSSDILRRWETGSALAAANICLCAEQLKGRQSMDSALMSITS